MLVRNIEQIVLHLTPLKYKYRIHIESFIDFPEKGVNLSALQLLLRMNKKSYINHSVSNAAKPNNVKIISKPQSKSIIGKRDLFPDDTDVVIVYHSLQYRSISFTDSNERFLLPLNATTLEKDFDKVNIQTANKVKETTISNQAKEEVRYLIRNIELAVQMFYSHIRMSLFS